MKTLLYKGKICYCWRSLYQPKNAKSPWWSVDLPERLPFGAHYHGDSTTIYAPTLPALRERARYIAKTGKDHAGPSLPEKICMVLSD